MIFSINLLKVFDKQKGTGAANHNFGSGSRRQFNFCSWAPDFATLVSGNLSWIPRYGTTLKLYSRAGINHFQSRTLLILSFSVSPGWPAAEGPARAELLLGLPGLHLQVLRGDPGRPPPQGHPPRSQDQLDVPPRDEAQGAEGSHR